MMKNFDFKTTHFCPDLSELVLRDVPFDNALTSVVND